MTVLLSGSAFGTPYERTEGRWPYPDPRALSNVVVGWRNETTGASGSATQAMETDRSDVVAVVRHRWYAEAALGPGVINTIAVTAVDAAGNAATQHVSVTQNGQSYEVKSRIRVESGMSFDGARLVLDGPKHLEFRAGRAGQVKGSCVPRGEYVANAASPGPFGDTFAPANLRINVDRDLELPEFVSSSRELIATVTGAVTSSVGQLVYTITRSDGVSWRTVFSDSNTRSFVIILPDGTYRVTPSCERSQCNFAPASAEVTIAGAVSNVSFEEIAVPFQAGSTAAP